MKKVILLLALIIIAFVLWKVFIAPQNATAPSVVLPTQNPSGKVSKNMTITSTAFENNSTIPSKYTCDGENINPPLEFSGVSSNAKSLVLLMDDPDVPKNLKPDGVFDHWVVYNIPSNTKGFQESSVPPGTQGLNGASKRSYTGPCPPDREHRYFFKLYALDSELSFDDPEKVDKKTVEQKMQGHILDKAELIGLYNRK